MLDTWRAAYFINACTWELLWAVSESSCLTSPDKRSHPPLQQMLILCSLFRSLLSINVLIHFLYYAFSLCIFERSGGNRRHARVQERSSEVTGSNHALGVIFNLAWGPSYSSLRNLHFTFAKLRQKIAFDLRTPLNH